MVTGPGVTEMRSQTLLHSQPQAGCFRIPSLASPPHQAAVRTQEMTPVKFLAQRTACKTFKLLP